MPEERGFTTNAMFNGNSKGYMKMSIFAREKSWCAREMIWLTIVMIFFFLFKILKRYDIGLEWSKPDGTYQKGPELFLCMQMSCKCFREEETISIPRSALTFEAYFLAM